MPVSIAALRAAPRATTSSTLTPDRGSCPAISRTNDRTIGIRVEPPTSRTPARLPQVSPDSPSASSVNRRVRSISGAVIASNSARVSSKLCRFRPSWMATRVEVRSDSDHLACSARVSTSLSITGSSSGSTPVAAWNFSARNVAIRSSQFLPPRSWSPAVARTSTPARRDPGHRHVERPAAEVVDQDRLVGGGGRRGGDRVSPVRPSAVGQRGGGRLVDDPERLPAPRAARPRWSPCAGRRRSRPGR